MRAFVLVLLLAACQPQAGQRHYVAEGGVAVPAPGIRIFCALLDECAPQVTVQLPPGVTVKGG